MSDAGGYCSTPMLADLYDLMPSYAGRGDVEFYTDCAREAGGRVLELGCGTGRVLVPLARAGFDVVGLDLSDYMLARCRAKLAAEPADVQGRARLVQGDMTDFDLGEKFALATTPFRPFQHLLHVADQLACLRCANAHLVKGGRLVLDLFNPDPQKLSDPAYMAETVDVTDVPMPDGRTFTRSHRIVAFHRAEQHNDVELIYDIADVGGNIERIVHAFPFRYFFRYEVEHLLARAGFRVAELYGGFDRSAFTDESPEMIFVAESVV